MDRYEYQGQMLTVRELLLLATNGISKSGLVGRLRVGVPAAQAITRPVLSRDAAIRYARRSAPFKRPLRAPL